MCRCQLYGKQENVQKGQQLEKGVSTRNDFFFFFLKNRVKRVNTSQGGAESLHLLFSLWNRRNTYPFSLKGAPLSTPLKSLGTNATPEYYPN